MPTTTAVPAGLAERGAAFWRTVTGDYELSASELAVLLEACRSLDDLDRLAAAISRDGVTVLGSAGQPVTNPAVGEARGMRLALHRLLAALALPDLDGNTMPTATSIRARTAASARWSAAERPKRGA